MPGVKYLDRVSSIEIALEMGHEEILSNYLKLTQDYLDMILTSYRFCRMLTPGRKPLGLSVIDWLSLRESHPLDPLRGNLAATLRPSQRSLLAPN